MYFLYSIITQRLNYQRTHNPTFITTTPPRRTMGNKASSGASLKKKDVDALIKSTHFDAEEIQALYDHFMQVAHKANGCVASFPRSPAFPFPLPPAIHSIRSTSLVRSFRTVFLAPLLLITRDSPLTFFLLFSFPNKKILTTTTTAQRTTI